MGSSVASTASPSRYQFDPRPWVLIGEGENYRILRNTINGQELEEYLHTATIIQFDYLRSIFQYRLDKDYLVATKFFRQEDRNQMCSTFFQGFLYIERIPLRMNEIKDLPFPDIVHLVNSCLRGFRQLYLKTGGFNVNQHMIGINSDAKVKVWFSQDFGSDRPYEVNKDQRVMVQQILQIIDKNIDKRTQPESITQALSRQGLPTFDRALALLNQYTIRHVISIPPYLTSIAELRDRGYFKKMPPRGQSIGNIPLQPSINRSLPLVTKSFMSSNQQYIPSPRQIPIGNTETTTINVLPPPQSVTINQPITTLNSVPPISQLPLLSPLSVPLAEPHSQKLLLANQRNASDIQRVPLKIAVDGVPQDRVNHLHYSGKQPLMSLAQKYPPPSDYSPTQPPPVHIKGHRTEVRSWISSPITRDGSLQRNAVKTNTTLIRPGTPSFGNLDKIAISPVSPITPITPINSVKPLPSVAPIPQISIIPPALPFPSTLPQTPSSSADLNFKPTSSTPTFRPDFLPTKIQNYQNYQNYQTSTSKGLTDYNKYDTYTSSSQYYTKPLPKTSNLPMIVIPNKIELTVTKITNRQPQGTTYENFILNPNESNVHSGLIKQIIQHTIGLQDCMKQGAYYNPTIIGQKNTEQITFNQYKDRSRASTANYTEYSTPTKKIEGGYTDPALLQHAIKGIASIIDSQKPLQYDNSNSSSYSNNINAYQKQYNNNSTFDSFNVKTSGGYSNSYNTNSQEEKTSPQIMAIVSQALNSRSGTSNYQYRTSQISQIQSVDYDSRHPSLIR